MRRLVPVTLLTAAFLGLGGSQPLPDPYSPSSALGGLHFGPANVSADDIPILLWWSKTVFPYFAEGRSYLVWCGGGAAPCYSTAERGRLADSRTRAVIFYGTETHPDDLPLPRETRHEWALVHEESPLNNLLLLHQGFLGLFNHTATFKRESDYPLSSQYIPSLEYLTRKKPVPTRTKARLRVEEGLAPVLYVQSHCDVPSYRDQYVAELMRYIRVDSYGRCLHNRDLPEHLADPLTSMDEEEFLQFISRYKFHLAFENALCEDYMTEKLMRPLHVGSVPVYKGSPSAKDWMPNNQSVILVDDFSSPKELAEFLRFLDSNDGEYEKYLNHKTAAGVTNGFLRDHLEAREWKINEETHPSFFRGFECHVCRKVNERIGVERAREHDRAVQLLPPKFANHTHLGCPQPHPFSGTPEETPQDGTVHQINWSSLYWFALDQVKAVQNMLAAGETNSSTFEDYLTDVLQIPS